MNDAVPYNEEETSLGQQGSMTPVESAALEEEAEDQAWPPPIDPASPGPVSIYEADNVSEGEIVRGLLEAEGIHAMYEPLPGLSNTGSVIIGETFRGSVLVPPHEAERAREIIAAYEAQPVSDEEIESAPLSGPDGSVV